MKKTAIVMMGAMMTAGMLAGVFAQDAAAVDTAVKAGAPVAVTVDTARTDTCKVTVINITVDKNDSAKVVVVKNGTDTIYTGARPHFNKGRIKEAFAGSREKSKGIAGGMLIGPAAINSRPLKDLINVVSPLKGRDFDLNTVNYEPYLMRGGFGFIGVGEGMRIGGGGQNGTRHFVSDRYSGDSAVAITAKVSYGGFLVEKAIVTGPWNWSTGMYLGSGSQEVTARLVDGTNYTMDFNEDNEDHSTIKSEFWYLELHTGFTYTILPIFHVGAEVSIPGFYSAEGFKSYTPDYLNVNPSFRVRILFGNLG
jgi:hypothetical protein